MPSRERSSSGFEAKKRRIKPPKPDKGRYSLDELRQEWESTPFSLSKILSYQRFKSKWRSSKLTGTLKFWISRLSPPSPERAPPFFLYPKETSPVLQQWFQATARFCFPERKQWAISERLSIQDLVRWSSFVPNERRTIAALLVLWDKCIPGNFIFKASKAKPQGSMCLPLPSTCCWMWLVKDGWRRNLWVF